MCDFTLPLLIIAFAFFIIAIELPEIIRTVKDCKNIDKTNNNSQNKYSPNTKSEENKNA